jgi:RNA polymerase sigma-70 factor (ECF subfamily)
MNVNAREFVQRQYVRDLVHHKARQLARQKVLRKESVEDIEQILMLDLLERLPNFDPEKATLDTFAADCVGHKISKMLRERKREMRDGQREGKSLDAWVRDEDGISVPRAATLSREENDRRLGGGNAEEQRDRAMDVEAVLSRLTEDQRKLCELLKTMSLVKAARRLGIPRTTAAYHLETIREVFREAGLAIYL